MAGYSNIPTKIWLVAISYLKKQRDLNALAQTNHHLHEITNPVLYLQHAMKGSLSSLFWGVHHGQPGTVQHALVANLAIPELQDPWHQAAYDLVTAEVEVIAESRLHDGYLARPSTPCSSYDSSSDDISFESTDSEDATDEETSSKYSVLSRG